MIVLHGLTSSKDRPHIVAACRAMQESGFATLRFDLFGHGESGGKSKYHTLYKWIQNTLTMICYARTLGFVTDIYLSGHSQGGLTAALAGGMAPDLVRRLILRAPAFMIPHCAREGSMLGRRFGVDQLPDEIDLYDGLTLSADYVRTARTIRPEEAVRYFPGPALLIHGDGDYIVPLEDSEKAAALYPRGQLYVLRGETHHFDRCQDQTCSVIRAWLLGRKKEC